MKTKFSTLDIIAILPELRAKICTGWRVNQVFDCDQKTYLFKLNKSIVQMKKDDDPLSVDEETANKMSFIIESGQRMHTTDYDWPKSHAPNHFATKLRKHIRNKRIEDMTQIGIDRAVDIQFGTNQAANHLIVELYDRGNMILTDYNYAIICILRWRSDKNFNANKNDPKANQNDSENLRIGQKYPLNNFRQLKDLEAMTEDKIAEMLNNCRILLGNNQNYKKRNRSKQDTQDGTFEINLKDLFNPHVVYGSSLLEDRLMSRLFTDSEKPKKPCIKIPVIDGASGRLDQDEVRRYAKLIFEALEEANNMMQEVQKRRKSPGYIVQKKQDQSEITSKINSSSGNNKSKQLGNKEDANNKSTSCTTNVDFFPILTCAQRAIDKEDGSLVIEEYESFDKAVDVYFSNAESQKLDTQALSAEREAMKKLDKLKISQERRLEDLARAQKDDEERARLIELNCDKVESALLIIRSMLANQIPWADIWATIKEAQSMEDPIASLITHVKFDRNEFTMKLCDPYEDNLDEQDEMADVKNNKNNRKKNKLQQQQQNQAGPKYRSVDIDISLSAYANARRFFTKRRTAVNKEKKTIEVSKKAFKNVERQTKERLKEVVVTTNITKARKRYWFENFFWFISSDGYLVVAGRDSEQNEMLVKRYMKNNDIYVHADLHGAASVIIKNESSDPIPPKTLVEAGSMAVCYSSAWDSKIATTSYWVYPKQVSKSAPTGEYLTQGAFIIRGKKNFLPLSNLVLGFGFLFRLEEDSIERRKKNRLAREQTAIQNGLVQDNRIDEESGATSKPSSDDNEDNNDDSCDDELDDVDDDSDSDHDSSDPENVGNRTDQSVAKGDSSQGKRSSSKDLIELKQSDMALGLINNSERDTLVVSDGIDGMDINDDGNRDDDEDDNENYDDDDDDDKTTEHRLMDTLSEDPQTDDVLLYAIAMCGPYSAFQNFKYKVKVIPGANKRGKAAKTCLGMFMHDKRASQRERDLLRALRDQDYARNIPNKVKVSAANLKTFTKRRPKKCEVRLPL